MGAALSPAKACIDCELCHHYTGGIVTFKCAKGHEAEAKWTTVRAACADYAGMSRAERLAKRFGSEWSGGTDIKPRQATARRMTSALQKAVKDFENFLTQAQLQTLKDAVGICAALGNDLEVAVRKADQLAKAAKAQRDAETRFANIALCNTKLPGATDSQLLIFCQDAASFAGPAGRHWFEKARNTWLDTADSRAVGNVLLKGATASSEDLAAAAGGFIDELSSTWRRSRGHGAYADFVEFRLHLRQQERETAEALL